jgi:hypothetical protein
MMMEVISVVHPFTTNSAEKACILLELVHLFNHRLVVQPTGNSNASHFMYAHVQHSLLQYRVQMALTDCKLKLLTLIRRILNIANNYMTTVLNDENRRNHQTDLQC